MAKIEVTGWVMEWAKDKPQPHWGMKFSETHSRKTDSGFEVVARTYWTVKAGWQVELDFSQFKAGDRVHIVGTQVTEKSTDASGKEWSNLVLRAETVERVQALREYDPSVPF